MAEPITISSQKSEPALDYEYLRKVAIDHISKTTTAIWTDFNIHDPGITTLELLCYAITDLGYRSKYSIPDLLATPDNTAESIQAHFLSAKQIFPNKAVTINDYRKLLIDIEGVKNAWLQKSNKQVIANLSLKKLEFVPPAKGLWAPVDLKGYYDVLIEFDTQVRPESKENIKQTVRQLLMSNRNLCEDFVNINEVNSQKFRLCAEIELASSADAFETLAKIFFNIQLHLTPIVKFYLLRELLTEGYTADHIFEGPLLTHGFIKDEELVNAALKTEIHLSDVMQQMLQVDGVTNILEIIFNPADQQKAIPNKWIIPVKSSMQAIVDIEGSNILFYKEGMPFRPDLNIVKSRFDQLMAAYLNSNEMVITDDIAYDHGVFQQVGNYYSIQNHYPKNYGISYWGLPGDASEERKMQAKQLKAYLYFFDQQLANYLGQLSNIKGVFSAEEQTRTYFTQLADSFTGADEIFADPTSVKNQIQSATETEESFYKRRNLFLDHLLSRFSESFFDYVNIIDSVFPGGNKQEIIQAKQAFLKSYPEYSSQRFLAYNYTNSTDLWNSANTSGLEKRLGRLLGFKDTKRRTLVNVYTQITSEVIEGVEVFKFEIIDNKTGLPLMISAVPVPTAETASDILLNVLALSNNSASYSIRQADDGQFFFEVQDATLAVLAISANRYNTNQEAINAVSGMIQLFAFNQSEEGMYLLENILLLPEQKIASPIESPLNPSAVQGFLPICVDDNCEDCESRDPYSFRISIVLPAYAPRFLNMNFRRFCERSIRMELPAHLFAKICWINNEQLQEFEKAYKAWLEVKSGLNTDPDNSILQRLINSLSAMKTVYPKARLEDCKNTEERTLFILNQNALGTL